MGIRIDEQGKRFERRRFRRDLQMLALCSERAHWTNELAILGRLPTVDEAYVLLADLERRRLVRRVVCQEPISWRLTRLGEVVAAMFDVARP